MILKNIFIALLFLNFLTVQAQIVIIPDIALNNYLLADTSINKNQDNLLQISEAQTVTHLDVSGQSIQDLTGIKSFKNLTNLNCGNNLLSTLDISGNVELDTLICDNNNLTSICVNSKQFQNIVAYSNNWIKDSTCEWSRKNCSIESDSCFALFYVTFVDSVETFYAWVDSLSTEKAVSFNWDFGDLGVSSQQPAPAYYYGKAELYTPCMKIYVASGDSCEYCHTIGYDTSRNIVKHGGGFNFRVKQFESTYFADTLVVDSLVGIDQKHSIPANYSIQPNPTNGMVNVKFTQSVKNISIRLLNLTGQAIIEEKNKSGTNFILDISHQAKGLYILEIIQDGILSIEKVIKQ